MSLCCTPSRLLSRTRLPYRATMMKRVNRKSISTHVTKQLYAASAGRCQFRGCKTNTMEHAVTFSAASSGERAHIYAYSCDGPRGRDGISDAEINDVANLMLLCGPCHRLVDGAPETYPEDELRRMKAEQEARVRTVADWTPETETRLVRLSAQVRGRPTSISDEEIRTGLGLGSYYDPRKAINLDLNFLDDRGRGYWESAGHEITRGLQPLLKESERAVSVFAIARLPLLVHLGTLLPSTLRVRIFNRHAGTDTWAWRESEPVVFHHRWLTRGNGTEVTIIASLSGAVDVGKIAGLSSQTSVVELYSGTPGANRGCISCESSLENLRGCYQSALSEVRALKPTLINLVPAAPAAAGIILGRDLLTGFDPPVAVYDWNGIDSYEQTLRVNENDQ